MIFTKRLREALRCGAITCNIRIWRRPRVTVGKRCRMEEGEIEIDALLPIDGADITPEQARVSGFKGLVDLLAVAKHGSGEKVYLVRFHYVPREQGRTRAARAAAAPRTTTRLGVDTPGAVGLVHGRRGTRVLAQASSVHGAAVRPAGAWQVANGSQ